MLSLAILGPCSHPSSPLISRAAAHRSASVDALRPQKRARKTLWVQFAVHFRQLAETGIDPSDRDTVLPPCPFIGGDLSG